MAHVEDRSQRGISLRRRASAARAFVVSLAAVALAAWLASNGTGAAQGWAEVARLRAFTPGAGARLEAGPGRRVRLVASNLPRPDALTPDARAFVVWATAAGRVARLGALRRGQAGGGTLEFRHPAGLARYSLVVTAELSTEVARPAGAPVLSTRALEVDPQEIARAARRAPAATGEATTRDRAATGEAATRNRAEAATRDGAATRGQTAAASRARVAPTAGGAGAGGAAVSAVTGMRSRVCAGRGCGADGFNAEVSRALAAEGAGARSLLLVGARGARGARGWARVANSEGAAYARVRFRRVPHPARFGARRHVLWAVTDEAGPVYVGSLPASRLNRAPAFVRAENVGDRNFRLLVTAEKAYPAARPAGRRVLLTYKGRRAARRPRK